MRLFVIVAATLTLMACQPAPPPVANKPESSAPKAADGPAAPAPVVERFVPAGGDDDDSSFRGPMTLEAANPAPSSSPDASGLKGMGDGKRYRLTWMDGNHVVMAVEAGVADGKAVIDRLEGGKPLTLAAALGAAADARITLLTVEMENGPLGDPDYTPLCGIRSVTDIAMLRSADGIALATSMGAFGAKDSRGCSNVISYKKAP